MLACQFQPLSRVLENTGEWLWPCTLSIFFSPFFFPPPASFERLLHKWKHQKIYFFWLGLLQGWQLWNKAIENGYCIFSKLETVLLQYQRQEKKKKGNIGCDSVALLSLHVYLIEVSWHWCFLLEAWFELSIQL